MRCPACQHENAEGLKFCGECGARLAGVCPSCGAANPAAQKFCGECGSRLAQEPASPGLAAPASYTPRHLAEKILTSRSALEGERKLVTVLFADLKGSMELLADRDPEEARKILDPVLELMMEAVHHYEGTVNQVMGDGIMALFGAPIAHEDHAETGALAGGPGAHRIARPVETIEIPATVQTILAARIDRLPPDEKHLLQAAAAIGKDVPFSILRSITDMPDATLRRDLAHLGAAEFLHESQLYPELEYTFQHALTHEVAYGSLVQDRRREFHGRIATAIETLYADRLTEQAERLAHHTVRAGLVEKAVRYLREAGVKALERSAYAEAIELLQQASTLLVGLPETAPTLTEALAVRMALGPALMATRGHTAPEVEARYVQAVELSDRLEDTPRRFPALWGLWYLNHGRGDYQRALQLAQTASGLAQGGVDPTNVLEAHHAMWSTLLGMGRSASAAEHCQRGLALYDRRERRPWWLYGTHDPGVCCRHIFSVATWLLGRPSEAAVWLREGLSLARELRHPFTTMISLHNAAWVYYHRGEADLATETANAALELGHAQGFSSVWPERVAVILARSRVEQGSVEEGLARAEEAVRQVTALGSTCWQDEFSCVLLAGAYGIAGHPDKGLQVIRHLAARGGTGFYQPEIHRVQGELLLARSPAAVAEAEVCFQGAIELAHARQEQSLALRAAASLARLLQRTGKRDQARSQLAEIYASFTEGLDTADLRAARTLLDELA